jgi:pyruvate dehydrogenase E2 component (dihydrolipoamide acetyltransferase)
LGEGADSGSVVNIFVKEGDRVQADQAVLELESEKAVASIPSPVAGTVTKIHVRAGDKIAVGQLILSLAEETTVAGGPPKPTPAEIALPKLPPVTAATTTPPASAFGPAASPAIRRLARELGIDLTKVPGSERGGRIVMADLRAYIQRLQAGGAPTPAKPVTESIDFSKWGPIRKAKASVLRKTIARRMTDSWTTIPHVTQFDETDITAILDLRKKHIAAYEQKGARLTVTSFVLRALATTLAKHPIFNASYDDAAGEIVFKQYCHIGIAVDTEHGLMVPVLRDVDKKSILQLSIELAQLADKAKERKITADEMKGGTFTISNQGGIGGGQFTPIVNKPEVAILGLGRGAVKAVVREGKIEPRTMLPLAVSYDHRVIDGANAARFIADLVQAIENFSEADVRI